MQIVRIALLCLLTGLLARCGSPAPPEPVDSGALDAASYAGIYDHPITLIDGAYAGESVEAGAASRPTVRRVAELLALGDLDGDGIGDAATLLVENSGGSGSFVYLAAMTAGPEGAISAGTALLGDRVQVVSLGLEEGEIVVDLIAPAEDDPMVSPSHKVQLRYQLDGDALVQIARTENGILSTSDLEGPIWLLLRFGQDRSVAAGVSITANFSRGRVSGSDGCNGYFAAYDGESPGSIRLGLLSGTRKACTGRAEIESTEFLARFPGLIGYRFSFGRLQLDYQHDETIETMVLEPHEPGTAG